MGPWQRPGENQAWGQGRPDENFFFMRERNPDGQRKEWSRKPGAKKPADKQHKAKAGNDQRIERIEARLTALEHQQQAMLVAIQEQQSAMMAALQRTNELVSAKLASLGRQQERARPMWDEARPERRAKELAKREKQNQQHPRQGEEDDRD